MATSHRPANKRLGTEIEEHRATVRGAQHVPERDWYDIDDGDTPVEVKTTQRTVESGTIEREGRYQLEGENHHQLVENGGEYDFVLRDGNGEEVETVTRSAEEIEALLIENDRKWPSGSKLKVRWTVIHNA